MTIVNYLNTIVIASNIITFIVYNLPNNVCKILSPLIVSIKFYYYGLKPLNYMTQMITQYINIY